MTQNRLARETSPYLLQHAENPVDWYAWGTEALDAAKRLDRPILLSVGYAACHWCHVMAHESFEDARTAEVMNRLFVNVKVDREERPDIDTIYMQALHQMGQQGGWPLTMFLTPDGEPFWGGTYFPPEDKFGRPAFTAVLERLAELYRDEKDKIAQSAGELRKALREQFKARSGGPIPLDIHDQAAARIADAFDMVHGGLGDAPKFPNPPVLDFLWRAQARTGNAKCRDAVLLTLRKMSQGGIYDHVGGGYARYSVDAVWLVPHFEKMLYDNAQILDLLAMAWLETGDPLFERRAEETVEWLMREMRSDGGAFTSSLDADSEGEEGKFYVWTADEIDRLLGADATFFKLAYDVTAGGNWEGHTILNRSRHPELYAPDQEATLARCRDVLLAERGGRVRPGWDDKVLADWNGLTIAALAAASTAFGRPDWRDAARTAFDFVLAHMSHGGRLRHSWRGGRAQHVATLDDYANMALAALRLQEATGDGRYVDQAEAWVAVLDQHYRDEAAGGYFLTADDAEALIVRSKTAADNATPSGNGIVTQVLARLFYITGKPDYAARAEAVIAAFSGELARNFFGLTSLFSANELLQDARQIVVVGAKGAADTEALVRAAHRSPAPNKLLQIVEDGTALPAAHPAFGKTAVGGKAAAYVCRAQTCSPPVTDPSALARLLTPDHADP